jgi:hypothetical protein
MLRLLLLLVLTLLVLLLFHRLLLRHLLLVVLLRMLLLLLLFLLPLLCLSDAIRQKFSNVSTQHPCYQVTTELTFGNLCLSQRYRKMHFGALGFQVSGFGFSFGNFA